MYAQFHLRVDVQKNARPVGQEFDFQHLNKVPEFAHARRLYRTSGYREIILAVIFQVMLTRSRFGSITKTTMINRSSLRTTWKNRMHSEMEDCRR